MNIELYHNIHEDQKIKGFLNYHYCSELEEVVQYNVYEVLEDNQVINTNYTGENEIDYLCIYAHGSRVFGNPRKDSDIDFVLFYKGTIREDTLFNIFVDESIYIEHAKCDFNPIEIDDESDIEYYIQKHDIEYHQNSLSEQKLVNLGLALDDYENDEIESSSMKDDVIGHEEQIKHKIDLEKYTVDLGLPSGALWCKFNMGCDPRFNYDRYKHEYCDGKGDWYGFHYAWGEQIGYKDQYVWKTYKYGQQSVYYEDLYNMTKYQLNQDGLKRLLPEDDVVLQRLHIHNFKFHIPTKDQVDELIDNTTQEWKSNYLGYEGLNGMIFKSKFNDNFIFLPAAGFYTESYKKSGEMGYYWTSDLSDESSTEAYSFWFQPGHVCRPHIANHSFRYEGLSIRPVIEFNI